MIWKQNQIRLTEVVFVVLELLVVTAVALFNF